MTHQKTPVLSEQGKPISWERRKGLVTRIKAPRLDMQDKDYYVTKEWSAYNFLFLKGPSPIAMFFSFKSMTIENHYNKHVVDRIKQYEII